MVTLLAFHFSGRTSHVDLLALVHARLSSFFNQSLLKTQQLIIMHILSLSSLKFERVLRICSKSEHDIFVESASIIAIHFVVCV